MQHEARRGGGAGEEVVEGSQAGRQAVTTETSDLMEQGKGLTKAVRTRAKIRRKSRSERRNY